MLYLTDAGSVVVQGEPLVSGMIEVRPLDRRALLTALRSDQAGRTTFTEFVQGCRQAGIVRFEVDLAARTCTYFGADDDHYVETYPTVEI